MNSMNRWKILFIIFLVIGIGCNSSIKDKDNNDIPINVSTATLSPPSPIIQLSITPSILLTIKPTSSITAEPSTSVTLSPTISSSPISPSPSTIPRLCETTTQEAARIFVFDEQGQFVDDATVKAEFDRTGNFWSEVYPRISNCKFREGEAVITKTYQGTVIIEIIGGVWIKYTVSKTGYTTQTIKSILINSDGGNPTLHDIYFGCPADGLYDCINGKLTRPSWVWGGSKYALSRIK